MRLILSEPGALPRALRLAGAEEALGVEVDGALGVCQPVVITGGAAWCSISCWSWIRTGRVTYMFGVKHQVNV